MSKVECLLYAFHTVGKQSPGFLVDNPDRLKDFRSRLQYFARGVQGGNSIDSGRFLGWFLGHFSGRFSGHF